MNLLNEIVAAAVKGVHIPFKTSHWDGSENGHPQSVTVQAGSLELEGVQLAADVEITVADGFDTAGPHHVSGLLTLPHGPSRITLDGAAIPDGKVVVVPVQKGRQTRAAVYFFCPRPGDPLFHYRCDATIARL